MTQLNPQPEVAAPRQNKVRLPNFLYIGTSKAGSTWIYHALAQHRQVFMAPGKGAYFFDQHFEKGLDWYRDQFRRANSEPIVGEVSHSYLFSRTAAQRIRQTMPDAKLMVCVREPIERAFSAYLDSVKNGRFTGSFSEALEVNDSLLERGAYATCLSAYTELFPRQQIHVAVFDDLKTDPQKFTDQLFTFLEIEPYELTTAMRQKMMPSARPRSRWVSQFVKRIARLCGRAGMHEIRGRAKRSRWVRNLLYRPYSSGEIPSIEPRTERQLRSHFRSEIRRLDEMLGTTLCRRWGYDQDGD